MKTQNPFLQLIFNIFLWDHKLTYVYLKTAVVIMFCRWTLY